MTPQQPQQDPPQAAPPPARKKRRKWPWVLGGIVLLIVVIVAASNNGGNTSPQPTGVPAGSDNTSQQQAPAQAATHTVIYKVTGTGTASDITYTTDGMTSMNQESNVKLPWSKTLQLPTGEALQMAQISAQGSSSKSTVDVTITVDGKLVKEAHATGYGVASADANIGTMGG